MRRGVKDEIDAEADGGDDGVAGCEFFSVNNFAVQSEGQRRRDDEWIFVGNANAQPRVSTWSAGVKLIVVCVLALLMNIPGLFVQGLVTERMTRAADAGARIGGAATDVTVDSYQSVNRSLKYVLLFEGLVFLTYFTFEVTSGRRVHPAQYVLVGVAQIIFYLLLLSLSEKVGFDVGFLIAGAATVGLLSVNAKWIFRS